MKQPGGHLRLTSYAIVRSKRDGLRFEVVCHKHTVFDWRRGVEKDLDAVLAIEAVFSDASKGIIANSRALQAAFGAASIRQICEIILRNGEHRLSADERDLQLGSIFRSVVMVAAESCAHPMTSQQLSVQVVESTLKHMGFSVRLDQTVEKQASRAITALCQNYPTAFARAQAPMQRQMPTENDGAMGHQHAIAGFAAHVTAEDFAICAIQKQFLVDGEVAGKSLTTTSGVIESAPCRTECSACNVGFADAREFRAHCRSEWHVCNLKRRVSGDHPVTEAEIASHSAADVAERRSRKGRGRATTNTRA